MTKHPHKLTLTQATLRIAAGIALGAAIAAAIDDAIGLPGAITRLPVTPQRLRAILKRAGRS